ncbi:MAG: hypothetical protein IKP28_01320 [Clostridia bacterium]|nr:hypothetical protein [Clostridia bacterium]
MASKSEMDSEARRDYSQWTHSLVLWRNKYNEATTPEEKADAYDNIVRCIREKIDMDYDFDYISFGVANITDEELEEFRRIEARIRKQDEPDSRDER